MGRQVWASARPVAQAPAPAEDQRHEDEGEEPVRRIATRERRPSMAPLEIGGAHFRPRQQFGARALHGDRAVDHDIAAMGELQRMKGVLLDEKDRQPLASC